jgi:antitoxin FitA
MASITIRNLDPALKAQLRIQAAQHGHSMEEEARILLRNGLAKKHTNSREFLNAIRARVAPVGGFDLDLPPREPARDPIEFDK